MKKKFTAEQIEAAAWAAALATEVTTDEVPSGWLTAKQIATKTGKAGSTIGTQLCRAVNEGRCERKSFRVKTGDFVRLVPHYRLK